MHPGFTSAQQLDLVKFRFSCCYDNTNSQSTLRPAPHESIAIALADRASRASLTGWRYPQALRFLRVSAQTVLLLEKRQGDGKHYHPVRLFHFRYGKRTQIHNKKHMVCKINFNYGLSVFAIKISSIQPEVTGSHTLRLR